MKEALFYKKEGDSIKCQLCPRNCIIKENKRGWCGVRKNTKGKLYSLVYNKPCAMHVDSIEKKPLYHFLPGSKAFSIGTVGCNLGCEFCQNYNIARALPEEHDFQEVKPEEVVDLAIKNNCKSIAYTYNDFTVFYEYTLDISKLAKKNNIKNVIVSNGFINEKPLKELCKYIDAANIDLKAFNDNFYKKYCNAFLSPVLDSLKILKENKVWLEITNLVIPGLNDNPKDFEKMCTWIKNELGKQVPLHLSRFYPHYKLDYIQPTSIQILKKLSKIAKEHLDYVYIGNILTDKDENTYCEKCQALLIEREGFDILKNNLKEEKCEDCKKVIPGIWY
ncbi:MAG: AmmeMemoRadiSam system radical SAM enzyme [Nanoarchaeota archaeon]|nr:AmmeMemoRadiSam system radical SAM enzyme [Nanoarchaeota archaeon]